MRWTVHLEGGPRRVNHAAVIIGDKIFSFGGYCSTEEYKDWEPIPVHILDVTTLRWHPIVYKNPDMLSRYVPFQRYGHTAVAHADKVYMWGGRNNAVACDTLCCFDTENFKWTTPTVTGMLPYAKDGHSACVIKNKMYIFGGFEYLTDQYSSEVHCLDLDTMKWTFVNARGTPPSMRDFHTAVAYGDRMYIFGGRGDCPVSTQDEVYCPQVYYLDTVTEAWITVNPKGVWPEGRRSHSSWVHNDYMYVFGGYNGNTKTHFNDLDRYSFKHNYWQFLHVQGKIPSKRRRQACLLHKNKVYLFGGTSPCPHMLTRPTTDDDNTDRLLDNSDLHILDYSPTLKTLCMLNIIEHKLDYSWLPQELLTDFRIILLPNRISRPINQTG